MDKCKIYRDEMWQDYLLNRLDNEELTKMQFHLLQCACCRDRVKQMRLMIHDMQDSGERKEKSKFQVRRLYRMVAVITLLLAMSVGGYIWVRTSSDEEPAVIINSSPIYNTIDSVKNEVDSVTVKEKRDTVPYPDDCTK